MHDFGPFYCLVAQLGLIPCSRLSISDLWSCISVESFCIPKYKVVALTICNHIQNLLKIRRNMLFMVAGLLLSVDTSYKPLPPFIDSRQDCRCNTKFAVSPHTSIFGSIVNIIDFLVARKTKKNSQIT